jgi:tRNA A37 threonylcarbamoyladenosine modification protein TsaB
MYLLLDLSENEFQRLVLFSEKKVIEKKISDKKNRELLFTLDLFLKENKIKKENIKAVAVVIEKGSFTSTRIACIIANMFVYEFKIKAVAVKDEEKTDYKKIIKKILKKKDRNYLSALYSAKANIN